MYSAMLIRIRNIQSEKYYTFTIYTSLRWVSRNWYIVLLKQKAIIEIQLTFLLVAWLRCHLGSTTNGLVSYRITEHIYVFTIEIPSMLILESWDKMMRGKNHFMCITYTSNPNPCTPFYRKRKKRSTSCINQTTTDIRITLLRKICRDVFNARIHVLRENTSLY